MSTLNIQVCLAQLPDVVTESLGRNVQESGEWSWSDAAGSFPLPDVTALSMTIDGVKR